MALVNVETSLNFLTFLDFKISMFIKLVFYALQELSGIKFLSV